MKWYLNGFPKSGLHLLEALLKPITQDGGVLGTYMYGSWAFDRAPLELLTYGLSYLPDGYRLIGHSCYDEDLDLFLYHAGIAHVFISRDLRDVTVSQAHHILHPDKVRFSHPDKELYQDMSVDEVVAAVWDGHGRYPGTRARWAAYFGWLASPHALCLRFEDVVADLQGAAVQILKYRRELSMTVFGRAQNFTAEDIGAMVASARDRESSPTFRRGVPGDWKKHRAAFEQVKV